MNAYLLIWAALVLAAGAAIAGLWQLQRWLSRLPAPADMQAIQEADDEACALTIPVLPELETAS